MKRALSDPDASVRAAAVGALAGTEATTRLDTLPALLRDPVREVRLEAARALAGDAELRLAAADRDAFRRALDEYIAVQRYNADRAEGHMNLALLELRRGNTLLADDHLARAIAVDPSFMPAYVQQADLYRARREDDKADAILRRAVEREPTWPWPTPENLSSSRPTSSARCASAASPPPTSTACDSSRTPSSRSPFALAVEPVETRSTIASERPSAPASASTEPETGNQLGLDAEALQAGARRDRICGCDAQPVEIPQFGLRGVVQDRGLQRAAREAELGERNDVRGRLGDVFAPVIPRSTTPSCTYSGTSPGAHEQEVDRRIRARHEERTVGGLEAETRVVQSRQGGLRPSVPSTGRRA